MKENSVALSVMKPKTFVTFLVLEGTKKLLRVRDN